MDAVCRFGAGRHRRGGRHIQAVGDDVGDAVALVQSDDGVDFGDFVGQGLSHAFGQTAGDDDFFDAMLFLLFDGAADGVHGLFFGRSDEAAGINDNRIRIVRIGADDEIRFADAGEHNFAVHDIFRASQCDESHTYRIFFVRFDHNS